ncbi:MAG TPA: ACT domain-containing protein [Gemmatimonadales bacterium]
MSQRLRVRTGTLAICRLAPGAAVPDWAAGPFVSVTRTPGELSVVCDEAGVPDGVRAERGWCALEVEGPLHFSLTGVLAGLAVPLADAGIPVFMLSTFDTDWLLVREPQLADALAVLSRAGHEVQE